MIGDRQAWGDLERDIVFCDRCPRLRRHASRVARERRRAYRDQIYWGKPVPAFGDPGATILLVGLAPAAHGANRTGRMFTGDRSGDWLYGALHRVGLASQGESRSIDDGLDLDRVLITAACRCAPPDNRPSSTELARCSGFLDREIALLGQLGVVVALGRVAWETLWRRAARVAADEVPRPRPSFGHGVEVSLPLGAGRAPIPLLASYHPSQQNTQTGRLTRPMLDRVLRRAARLGGVPRVRRP